jgi:hypothetical protein
MRHKGGAVVRDVEGGAGRAAAQEDPGMRNFEAGQSDGGMDQAGVFGHGIKPSTRMLATLKWWWLRARYGSFALARAAWHFLACKPVLVPLEKQQERMKQCEQCEHLNGGNCELCGCNVALKVMFATEMCPDRPPRWV